MERRIGDSIVLIDDDMGQTLDLPGWHVDSGYVRRDTSINGKRIRQFLHHVVLGIEPSRGFRVDHRNRNRLDNRRENLRVVTVSENAQNRSSITNRGTNRGVTYRADKGKWMARATVNYLTHHIGYFDFEEEAVVAVAEWRAKNMRCSEADRGVL